MAPHAVFRFDASPGIGSGHGVRSLALAQRLADAGWRVSVAALGKTFETVAVPAPMRRVPLAESPPDEAARIGSEVGSADLLVVDHYGRDARFETACRAWARRILAIDDLADRPRDGDVLLDQTLGRREDDYRALVPAGCRMLLGPRFALLRPEFAAVRPASLARRRAPCLKRILVSMGGTDPHDVAATAVRGILRSGLPVEVDVALGAAAPSPALAEAADTAGARVRILPRAGNVAELMAEADLAIGAGGVTSWERCCMGLPALVVVTAGNQETVAARLAETGAIRLLGAYGEVEPARIATAIRELDDDPEALKRMSGAGRDLCDGKGVRRASAVLAGSERDRRGRAVTLRLVEPDDTWRIFSWQATPGVRRYMTNPEIPTEAEHLAWMSAKLDDPRGWFCMIESAGSPVGVLRLDEDEIDPTRYVVAIQVAPDQAGMGVGHAALRIAGRLLPGTHLVARVAAENSASMRLFANAGYAAEADGLFHFRPGSEWRTP